MNQTKIQTQREIIVQLQNIIIGLLNDQLVSNDLCYEDEILKFSEALKHNIETLKILGEIN